MAKLQHLPAVPVLLELKVLLVLKELLLALMAIERLNQEPQTKKSAPWRIARNQPPPKQA